MSPDIKKRKVEESGNAFNEGGPAFFCFDDAVFPSNPTGSGFLNFDDASFGSGQEEVANTKGKISPRRVVLSEIGYDPYTELKLADDDDSSQVPLYTRSPEQWADFPKNARYISFTRSLYRHSLLCAPLYARSAHCLSNR